MSFIKSFFHELIYGSMDYSEMDDDIDYKIEIMTNKDPEDIVKMEEVLQDMERYLEKENFKDDEHNKLKLLSANIKNKLITLLENTEDENLFKNFYIFIRLYSLIKLFKIEESLELESFFKTKSNLYIKIMRKFTILDKTFSEKRLYVENGGEISKTYKETMNICDVYFNDMQYIEYFINSDFIDTDRELFSRILDNLKYFTGICSEMEKKYYKYREEEYSVLMNYINLNYLIFNTVNKKSDNFIKRYDITRWMKFYEDLESKQEDTSYLEDINIDSLNTVDRLFEESYDKLIKNEEFGELLYEDRKNFYKRLHYLAKNYENMPIYKLKEASFEGDDPVEANISIVDKTQSYDEELLGSMQREISTMNKKYEDTFDNIEPNTYTLY